MPKWWPVAILLTCSASIHAQSSTSETPLNSERIEATFGSYGIEVLHSDTRIRVSDLYSEMNGQRTTRTLAVVLYPSEVLPSYAMEHAQIVSGGSIGAVFAERGWTVIKHNRLYARVSATAKLSRLMRTEEGSELAVHIYLLVAERDGLHVEYASIAEIHHPDYLGLPELVDIYGGVPELSTEERNETKALLERVHRIIDR